MIKTEASSTPVRRSSAGRQRNTFLPFHLPHIGEAEVRAVEQTLRSGWITTGVKVRAFEQDFAQYIGARHAIAVNSATAGLHLALEAIGVRAGDEVIVPTMTFAASAEVAIYLGATPVLVDCQSDTLNMDPDAVERAITPRTKAIMPVHFGGQPCDMDRIQEIARRHNLRVVEDAAHALPAAYKGRAIGSIGDLTCFSFYATKTITTGEGGMVTTDCDEHAERIRIMSLHGISRDAWNRYTADGSWYYEILQPGYKYNLTDIAAAIGIEQLKRCQAFHDSRRRIARRYDRAFADLRDIILPVERPDVEHAWHLYVIQLRLESLRINRGEFIEALKAAQIGSSVHFIPLHLHPYYRERWGYERESLPRASAAFERIISLPIYPDMTDADVDDVVRAVRRICRRNRR
jgi:dTDP-4-amino-4,6-dideoxygalactose transaminase